MAIDEVSDLAIAVSNGIVETLKDDSLLKTILQTASDILEVGVPGVKLAYEIATRYEIARFKGFLIGYSRNLSENVDKAQRIRNRLIELSSKPAFVEYISNVYESAHRAKSIKNTAILGFDLAAFLDKKSEIGLRDLIFLEAFKELSDYEMVVFLDFFNIALGKEYFDPRLAQDLVHDLFETQLVIEKLKTLRIVSRGVGSFESSEQFGMCIFSEITIEFHNRIFESGVYTETIEEALLRVVEPKPSNG